MVHWRNDFSSSWLFPALCPPMCFVLMSWWTKVKYFFLQWIESFSTGALKFCWRTQYYFTVLNRLLSTAKTPIWRYNCAMPLLLPCRWLWQLVPEQAKMGFGMAKSTVVPDIVFGHTLHCYAEDIRRATVQCCVNFRAKVKTEVQCERLI